MRTIDYFKNLMFGLLLLFCLALVPVEFLVLRTVPTLTAYISPFMFGLIFVISLVVSLVLAGYGIDIIRVNLGKYVSLIKYGNMLFRSKFSANSIVIRAALDLYNKVIKNNNVGIDQASKLLDVIWQICKHRIWVISYRKLDKYFKIVQEYCPSALSLKVEVESDIPDVNDVFPAISHEYLVIRYIANNEIQVVKRIVSELR